MDLHVLSCGGTIASEPDDDGAAPAKDGAELLGAVPGLADVADVTVEDVASLPGFDMDPEAVAAAGRRVRAADADGVPASDASGDPSTTRRTVDGVVVTQGTDTMCETAYYLDLALSPDVPVVVTGAQRRLDEPSSDAPANLLAAATAAVHDRVGGGAYVAFDDELHAARHAVKAHSRKLSAVASPGPGPVAERTRDGWRFHRAPRSESADVDALATDADVPVVTSGMGAPAEHLERHVAAGADGVSASDASGGSSAEQRGADGVVVAGTGLGNVTASLGEAVRDVDLPVVVASRCHAGGTGAVYGTPGGAVSLASAGALPAGGLSPPKARVKLMLALAAPGPAADLFDAW